MDNQELRIAIAEFLGIMKWSYALPTSTIHCDVPDFPQDLNAMHYAEEKLTDEQSIKYREELLHFQDGKCIDWILIHATAEQRALAFVAVINDKEK